MDVNGCHTGENATDPTNKAAPTASLTTTTTTTNDSATKTNNSKFKIFKSLDWDDYLKFCNGTPAPVECFNHHPEPPTNEFHMKEKLEYTSPFNRDFVHLATVVGSMGPRLQLRLDGCDSSNDFFELVDSDSINPVGTRKLKNRYFAAPLRFRKDAASYASFCSHILKNALHAPNSAFKPPPTRPTKNLFQPGMKLEAVDLKHSCNICPATIKSVENSLVEIHLDGWDSTNDFKCPYYSRDLFPVGWCKKTGLLLQYPGPKAEYKENSKILEASIISSPTKAAGGTCPSNDEEKPDTVAVVANSNHVKNADKIDDIKLNTVKSAKGTNSAGVNSGQVDGKKSAPETDSGGSEKSISLASVNNQNNRSSSGNSVKKAAASFENQNSEKKNSNHVVESSKSMSITTAVATTTTKNILANAPKARGIKRPNNHQRTSENSNFDKPPPEKNKKNGPTNNDIGTVVTVPLVNGKKSSLSDQFRSILPSKHLVESWSIEELIEFLNLRFPEFTKFEHQFRSQEIDGKAFLMLTNDLIMKFLNIKLGYSLKIIDLIERINQTDEMNC